jgi:hypothetical protein
MKAGTQAKVFLLEHNYRSPMVGAGFLKIHTDLPSNTKAQ